MQSFFYYYFACLKGVNPFTTHPKIYSYKRYVMQSICNDVTVQFATELIDTSEVQRRKELGIISVIL